MSRFEVAMLGDEILTRLRAWEPFPLNPRKSPKDNTQWVVVRYHPSVPSILSKALGTFKRKWCTLGYTTLIPFKLCWSKASKKLAEDTAYVQGL